MDDVARARLMNEAKCERLIREKLDDSDQRAGMWTLAKLRALDRVCPICKQIPRDDLEFGSNVKGWVWLNGRWVHEKCQR